MYEHIYNLRLLITKECAVLHIIKATAEFIFMLSITQCRPRNRWQDEVREDGRITGGEGWQEKIYKREESKKLLRMVRNHRILHMPME